jgi:hypothetical protein
MRNFPRNTKHFTMPLILPTLSKYRKYALLAGLLIIITSNLLAQTDTSSEQIIRRLNARFSLILTDKADGTTFILDSTRTKIKAISKNGNILWQTNPILENNLKGISDYPLYIIAFRFMKDSNDANLNKIFITTSSRYGGYINMTSGKYTFVGRD